MIKPLSEQLAELSVRSKKAEDAATAAEKEARDKIATRQQQACAAAKQAVEKVDQKVKSAGNSAARDLSTVKAKISADLNALKAEVSHAAHRLDVKHAERRADRLQWQADFAIDYAVASVEQAGLAALDAILGRAEAELAKQAKP